MKQLERLLIEQGGKCFFCNQPLAKADASLEHLIAQANGGTSAEENVVACCRAINLVLASKPLKEKIAVILRQERISQCFARQPSATDNAPTVAPATNKLATSQPVQAERSPTSSHGKQPAGSVPKSPKLAVVSAEANQAQTNETVRKCPTCRSSVPAAVGQVDFVCPKCKGAFRY